MVLTKESDFYKVLKEIVNSVSETKGFGTEIQSIVFYKGEVILNFSEDRKGIRIYDKNIDFYAAIFSDAFIPFVLNEFESKDKVTIEYSNSEKYIYINQLKFKASEDTSEREAETDEEKEQKSIITFSPEQFKNLEKDFKFSSENYYKNPNTTDTILFGINSGNLYEVAAGVCGYKLSKFDGTEDEVALQQLAGHEKYMLVLPHFYYNILKNRSQNISVFIYDLLIYSNKALVVLKSGNVEIFYRTEKLKTDCFEKHIKWFAQINSGIEINRIPQVVEIANILTKYNYQTTEDKEFFFEITDKYLLVDVEDLKLKYSCNVEQNIKVGINSAAAFSYIASQISDKAILAKLDDSERLFIKDGDSLYSIYDSASDYYV